MKTWALLLLATVFGGISQNQINAQQNKITPLDPLLENYQYPFDVKFITLSVQQKSYRMAFMDIRPEQANGHTVLLFHGKNFNGAYWQQTAETLQKAGFRIIIPDQLGFGKSSKPDIQYSFQLLALNTKNLLDSLQIMRTAVLGHSMGGMLATRFTLMFPGTVEKLILENPIGLEDWKLKTPYQSVDAWYKNELGQNYEKIKKYQQENYYHGQWKPEYEKWVTTLAGWSVHPEYKTVAWNAALTYDMIFTQPVLYEFENIKTPTLLIIGQLDRTALGKQGVPEEVRMTMGNYPKLGKETSRKIAGSTLVELENVGHLPHIEAFDLFITPLLAFLKQ
ncbi:MAG: alpha/beta hydrolase [Chitinophagaceae bacterium]|nr:alpha/beta hydrolase [Chitinophagaceae bacterium]